MIAAVPEPVWFAYARGERLGPMDAEALRVLARRGELGPEDLVWEGGTPEWVPARVVLPFDPAPAPPRVGGLLDDLASFSFRELVPLGRLLDPGTLSSPAAVVLLLFGLAPLVVGTLVEDPRLRVRLFNFGCGALWTAFFVLAFKTERQSLKTGVAAFFATGVLGILVVSVLQQVPPVSWLYGLTASGAWPVRLVAYVLGVGVLEEAGKGLVVWFLVRSGTVRDPSDGVFYGLLSGLGFGVYEAVAYTEFVNAREAAALSWRAGSSAIGLYGYFVATAVRIVSLPLLHAVWSALVGYFLGLSLAARRSGRAVLLFGLALAAVLHGLYDAFLSGGLPFLSVAVAALSLLLFLAYRGSAHRLLAEVRRVEGA